MRSVATLKLLLASRWLASALLALLWAVPATAHAGMFQGEALDTAADILTWVVLIVAPVIGIGVFLIVHILPEKIAEKRHHPQFEAIKTLCLLSLVFGGMLWPLAWLWAYSKPVMYKLAYGTDKLVPGEAEGGPAASEARELQQLRERIAALEAGLAGNQPAQRGA
jgi:hypothetical protein